jgi:hypothetical protein
VLSLLSELNEFLRLLEDKGLLIIFEVGKRNLRPFSSSSSCREGKGDFDLVVG